VSLRRIISASSGRHLPLAAFVAGVLLASVGQTSGAIITAASPSLADVSSAVALASDGDTVILPPGTASWTSTLTITKGITLQGSTTVTGAGTAAPTVVDGTVILDDVPIVNDKCHIIDLVLAKDQAFRITGITLRHGSRTTKPANPGAILVCGVVHGADGIGSLRIDHCYFDLLYQNAVFFSGWVTNSVIDHCVGNYWYNVFSFTVNNGNGWNGGDTFGNSSWADDSYFGTDKFVFIEDNTFNNTTPAQTCGTIDCQAGGRYVARHNYFFNCAPNTHGTESGGLIRGIRAHEWYQNTIEFTFEGSLGLVRAGTGISWGNTLLGGLYSGNRLTACRQTWPWRAFQGTAPDSGADGANSWDLNVTESDGATNVPGHSPYLFASGTAALNSTDGITTGTVTVSGNPGWQTDQWVGYSITNTTQGPSAGLNYGAYITGSGSNTITYSRYTTATPPSDQLMHFTAGDGFTVHKLIASIDQPGYGKCDDLIAVDSSSGLQYNSTFGGVGTMIWPHQHREPLYSWLNTLNGSLIQGANAYYHSEFPAIQPNREFYNEISPFDGSTGVGVGTLAQRPSTCTPGVAYWATDQGEWDSTHPGPDGQLYVCTAPNTWTLYYKPYVYPYPLVSGMPAAPANLRIVSGP
jgi:hypothetical protein